MSNPGATSEVARRWAKRIAGAAAKIALLSLPALLGSLLLLEVFARLLLPVSDYPGTYFEPALGNRYLPDQRGTYAAGEIRARFRINDVGWNSWRDYAEEKAPGVRRVAVVGDSFVEALQVDYDRSYPALLEERLGRGDSGPRVEVYAFGMSGASLAQYAFVLEQVCSRYALDLAIVNVVANDFAESLTGRGRVDNWTLRASDGGFEAVAPRPAGNLAMKQLLRHSALARYLVINQKLPQKVRFVRDVFYGDVRNFEANVDTRDLDLLGSSAEREKLLRDILRRYQAAAGGTDLILVLDANRRQIYGDDEGRSALTRPMFVALARIARESGIGVLDLTEPFREAYRRDPVRFEFANDGHWNARGHRAIADALAAELEPTLGRGSGS